MGLELTIKTGQGMPIYRQLQEQLRRQISKRKLAPGTPLPSVRTLAEQLVINPNTVVRAYAELASEGLIESAHGRGFYVTERRQIYSDVERERRLKAAASQLAGDVFSLDYDTASILKAVEQALQELKPKRSPSTKD